MNGCPGPLMSPSKLYAGNYERYWSELDQNTRLILLRYLIYHFEGRCNKDLFSEYIQILEMIVGPEDAKRLKLTTYASDPAIKDLFKGMLHKIQNTRSADDLVTEVRDFIVIADKLIDYAYDNDDYEAYLLAMVVKSDYSWVFVEKLLDENYYLLKANPAIKSISSPQQSYQHYITTTVKLKEGDECIWLAESKGRIFTLSLWGKNFVIRHVKEWEKYKMDEWLDKGFDSLSFDETINRNGQIEQYLESDQLEDELRVKKELQFASLEKTESKSIIIVKDMDLSKFPHNLILDNNGNFISSYKPMVCVPSIEWFIESGQADVFLGKPYTTSLWIPTDSGDYALNLLWSRLSNAISGFNINIQTTIAPSASLNSDVNILISHGSRDISTSHNISPGEGTTLVGTDLLISRGSILILFICHSGSMTKALFRDKVMSLIRQYFQAGCQAIVAPLWSLHVSVPPIWLPAFINSIENNDTVAEAVHKANMEVYSINKNPGAWACLHLYGNPYIKIHSHN